MSSSTKGSPRRHALSGTAMATVALLAPCVAACGQAAQQPADPPGILQQFETAITQIARSARPAIVSIQGYVDPEGLYGKTLQDRFPFHGGERGLRAAREGGEAREHGPEGAPGRRNGSGSGFLLKGGFVVTTAEVTLSLKDMLVTMPDGRRLKPQWIDTDREANVAVLKVAEADPGVGLEWGRSARLSPGSLVLTLGNQAGFPASVALGVVSGIERGGRAGPWRYRNLLQFQGSVGGGSGGGAVLNSSGEVVGMIVAMPAGSPDGRYEGVRVRPNGPAFDQPNLYGAARDARPPDPYSAQQFFRPASSSGFALPADSIRQVAELLCRHETPQPHDGWLGFQLEPVPAPGEGIRVSAVYEGGSADRAGMAPGDTISEIDGAAVRSFRDLGRHVWGLGVGVTVNITFTHNGARRSVSLITTARPFGDEILQIKKRSLHPDERAVSSSNGWRASAAQK